jgi:hypothetical protein
MIRRLNVDELNIDGLNVVGLNVVGLNVGGLNVSGLTSKILEVQYNIEYDPTSNSIQRNVENT